MFDCPRYDEARPPSWQSSRDLRILGSRMEQKQLLLFAKECRKKEGQPQDLSSDAGSGSGNPSHARDAVAMSNVRC